MIKLTKLLFSSYPVVFILVLGLIIRIIIALFLFPGYDEAYYFLYSKNLDWSYFDHPIFVALTTGIGVWLTGEVNQFTIRIGTLIISTVSFYLLYVTGKKVIWFSKCIVFPDYSLFNSHFYSCDRSFNFT